MKHTVRALLALTLLVGFYVFALGVVVGLVWAGVAVAKAGVSGYALGKLWIFVVVIGFVVVKALFGRRKKQHAPPPGIPVTEQEQPALWAEVRAIAEFAQTRAPDEIRLVPDVNAAVSEDAQWLGLVSGTRRLYLGVPLVLGLTRDQLRSVLAHELGHYSGKHTALGVVTYRGQEAIARVIGGLGPDSWTAGLFKLYARLYYAVSHTVSRRQELEADELSAALVGPRTAASALAEIRPISAAWDFYLESYVDLGDGVGHRPTDLYDGFARFLASPVRQEQLSPLRDEPDDRPTSVYDTHPAMSDRIARIEASGRPSHEDASGPATSLLAAGTVERAQEEVWAGDPRPGLPLAAIVPLAAAESLGHNARVVRAQLHALGTSPDLAGALGMLREGRAGDLLRPLRPDADDQTLRRHAGSLIGDLAAHQLVSTGAATHRLDFDGPWRLVTPEGDELEPWPASVAAAEDPASVTELESWLHRHGVELRAVGEVDVTLPRRDLPPDDEVLAVAAPVGGSHRTLVVLGQGVVLRKAGVADRIAVGKASLTGGVSKALVRQALKDGVGALLASPRATLLRWDEIRSATWRGKILNRGVLTITTASGEHRVKFIVETEAQGDPVGVMEHFVGERFSRG